MILRYFLERLARMVVVVVKKGQEDVCSECGREVEIGRMMSREDNCAGLTRPFW